MTDNNLSLRKDYFELRSKRLALVYKILYVIVAIWIACIISASRRIDSATLPVYVFLFSISTQYILNTLKYILLELQCMKIVGPINNLADKSEEKYSYIWSSFGFVAALNLILMLVVFYFINIGEQNNMVNQNIERIKCVCCRVSFCIGLLELIKNIINYFSKDLLLKHSYTECFSWIISPVITYTVSFVLFGGFL